MIEILELIWENLVDIIVGVFLIKNTAKRSAKKEAKFKEATEESRTTEKRKRLQKLRQEDNEMAEKMKTNLIEEKKLEKELGENA